MTSDKKEIIRAMADNDLNTTRVAKQIHRHRNTVVYWVNCIKKETGLDCRKYWDMVKLMEMVEDDG